MNISTSRKLYFNFNWKTYFNLPKIIHFNIPKIAHFNLPKIVHFNLPKIAHSNLPKIAHFNIPKMAHFNLPKMTQLNLPKTDVLQFPENEQTPKNSKLKSSETAIVRITYLSGNIISRKRNISMSQKWDASLTNLANFRKNIFYNKWHVIASWICSVLRYIFLDYFATPTML